MEDKKEMLNPPEVVVVPSTTETQQVVNPEPEPTNQAGTVVEPEAQPAPIPSDQPLNADVDEFGVPWKNRAMEYKRKTEELTERLPQMIEEKLKVISQPQTPQYSYEQLESYKLANSSNAEAVAWATGEQRKITQVEQRRLFEEVVGGREKVIEGNLKRQNALNYVQTTYPDAFIKDSSGRLMGWNNANPLTQEIGRLMADSRLANDPDGLALAADAAYGRVARMQTPQLQAAMEKKKLENRQLQKATLTEGGGNKIVQTTSPQHTAMENLRKTGSVKDAESAIGAILKQKGILQE